MAKPTPTKDIGSSGFSGGGNERESHAQRLSLPPRWEERVKAQLERWEEMFSKNNFDVQ